MTAAARKSLILPSAINVDALDKSMAGLSLGTKPLAEMKAEKKEKKKGPAGAPPAAAQVAEHPFARVDLRVGRIVAVERHPNADRLYVETVDLGEPEPRTVVSGLVEHVPREELADRMCVFVCNLKPATLCKTLSSAMLLVAKDAEGQLEPLVVPEGAKPGDRVSIDGVVPQPDAVIKPKEDTWEKVRVDLAMKDGVAYYTDKPLLVATGKLTSTKVPIGSIS
jgi:methionine--tRNA ligase beta chain